MKNEWAAVWGLAATWSSTTTPCLATQLRLKTFPICQAASGIVTPVHLFLYMALQSWLSSLQHTFETEIALFLYTDTHTHTFHFTASQKNWEYEEIYLHTHPLILVSYFHQQLKTGFSGVRLEQIANQWGPALVFCFCNTEQLWSNLKILPTVQKLIIILIMPSATVVQTD